MTFCGQKYSFFLLHDIQLSTSEKSHHLRTDSTVKEFNKCIVLEAEIKLYSFCEEASAPWRTNPSSS